MGQHCIEGRANGYSKGCAVAEGVDVRLMGGLVEKSRTEVTVVVSTTRLKIWCFLLEFPNGELWLWATSLEPWSPEALELEAAYC